MTHLDHLVVAVPELIDAVDRFEQQTGVRPEMGGAHPGRGSHNALVSLGEAYLELMAPDPDQPPPAEPWPFSFDELEGPTIVGLAVRPPTDSSIEDVVAAARAAGHDPGDVVEMGRTRPDGSTLRWRFTLPTGLHGGLVPFLIDWGDAAPPAATAPGGVVLVDLGAEHPDPEIVRDALAAVDFRLPVRRGPQPRLHAHLRGPAGTLDL